MRLAEILLITGISWTSLFPNHTSIYQKVKKLGTKVQKKVEKVLPRDTSLKLGTNPSISYRLDQNSKLGLVYIRGEDYNSVGPIFEKKFKRGELIGGCTFQENGQPYFFIKAKIRFD